MLEISDDVGPPWLSQEMVRSRLLSYMRLLQWSDDHEELDLHFMVGVGDRLWTSVGTPPNLGRKQGVLAYAVVTLPRAASTQVLDTLIHHILQTLASNYLTTLTQLGEEWTADEPSPTFPPGEVNGDADRTPNSD